MWQYPGLRETMDSQGLQTSLMEVNKLKSQRGDTLEVK